MEVRKPKDSPYQIDGKTITDLSEVKGAVQVLKKPIPIIACKIVTAFTVETTEGIMSGKPGDWLMQGVNKEMYICPADIFDKSYDIL